LLEIELLDVAHRRLIGDGSGAETAEKECNGDQRGCCTTHVETRHGLALYSDIEIRTNNMTKTI
jgi:hypothetical protein